MLSGSSGAGLDRSGKIVSYRLITAPIIVGSMSAIPTRTPSLPHDLFHPAVRDWFTEELGRPTAPQVRAWPSIKARRHTLIAAPTGSGKTLAAFLAVIDDLVREGLENGGLPDHTLVVYVSPLKALSNDIDRNLEAPLQGITSRLEELESNDIEIRTAVRTGDPTGRRASD
jgi:ATP-dependent Lhr-like helicase